MSNLPAPKWDYSPQGAGPLAVACDVGGTTIKTALVGRDGKRYCSSQVPTPHGGPQLVTQLGQLWRFWLEEGGRAGAQILDRPGIAVPGVFDEASGRAVLSANLGWADFPMRQALEVELGAPVALGHDVRCGARAEAKWNLGEETCYFLALGTGVGAATIYRGQVLSQGGWSGEVGQVLVVNPDYPAGVGTPLVPLEKVASAIAFGQRYGQLLELAGLAGPGAKVSDAGGEVGGDDGVAGGAGDLTRAAFSLVDLSELEFSPQAQAEWSWRPGAPAGSRETVARWVVGSGIAALGGAIAQALSILGPVPVIIGGGLVNEGPALLAALTRAAGAAAPILPQPRLVAAKLGSWAQAIGAAEAAFAAWAQEKGVE